MIQTVQTILSRLAVLATALVLAASACVSADAQTAADPPRQLDLTSGFGGGSGYGAVTDNGFDIPAVAPAYLANGQAHIVVPYYGTETPGSIVVDIYARKLYYILPGGKAIRYAVAVGRAGLSFKGTGQIDRKVKWPSWQPTQNMLKTRPDLYAAYANGLPGGIINPLGARALYLYRNGRDTMFRIHGTIDNASIGHATSAGCIRLFDQDAIDLFERVKLGTVVHVRTLSESLAMEGPYMNDAWGRAVPDTPQNRAKKVRDLPILQAQKAARAAAIRADPALAASESESLDPPPGYN